MICRLRFKLVAATMLSLLLVQTVIMCALNVVNDRGIVQEADSVLDITAIRQAALHLGDVIALATIRGGLHDLSMSKPDARRKYFRIVTTWASMMAWRRVIPEPWVSEALAKL